MKKIPKFEYCTHRGKLTLTEIWECNYMVGGNFVTGAGAENLVIEKGFATNGASIPRLFWSVLSPFDPRYLEEATIHDYLCEKGQYKRANAWFEQLLIDNDEIAAWHRKVFIMSVKSWHWCAYKKDGYFEQAQPRAWLKIVRKILNKKGA